MKHDLRVTIFLLVFFMLAQIIGLFLLKLDIAAINTQGDTIQIVHKETSLGPRPDLSEVGAFAYVLVAIALGTVLVMLIIKTNKVNLWKAWFFLAVFFATSLALGVLFDSIYLVYALALALTILKLYRPAGILHNLSELFIYAGIAIFIVPLLNVMWAIILLLIISAYDFVAVFKSKHMVTMAKFQAKTKMFAGLFVPYVPAPKGQVAVPTKARTAVLGGGDIAFPLIFTGTVMESLIIEGLTPTMAFVQSTVITACVVVSLASLFVLAEKDKFYPAMPIVTLGCLLGYLVIIAL